MKYFWGPCGEAFGVRVCRFIYVFHGRADHTKGEPKKVPEEHSEADLAHFKSQGSPGRFFLGPFGKRFSAKVWLFFERKACR